MRLPEPTVLRHCCSGGLELPPGVCRTRVRDQRAIKDVVPTVLAPVVPENGTEGYVGPTPAIVARL